MSDGTCWAPSSSMTAVAAAHTTAHLHARGHAPATASATSAARIVWPLGNELSNAATCRPCAKSAGRVSAIDSVVNESTRNVQAQATLPNPAGKLRPGMFVQTEVLLGATGAIIAVPASAISYAPYGDSVFVVGDLKDPHGATYRGVRQVFVKLGGSRGDQIAITSGLKAGDEIVTSGVFKLCNGVAVLVNNKVRPANSPAPKPENS